MGDRSRARQRPYGRRLAPWMDFDLASRLTFASLQPGHDGSHVIQLTERDGVAAAWMKAQGICAAPPQTGSHRVRKRVC
jgi:hypothetical protein